MPIFREIYSLIAMSAKILPAKEITAVQMSVLALRCASLAQAWTKWACRRTSKCRYTFGWAIIYFLRAALRRTSTNLIAASVPSRSIFNKALSSGCPQSQKNKRSSLKCSGRRISSWARETLCPYKTISSKCKTFSISQSDLKLPSFACRSTKTGASTDTIMTILASTSST